jgi:hypothetical protein
MNTCQAIVVFVFVSLISNPIHSRHLSCLKQQHFSCAISTDLRSNRKKQIWLRGGCSSTSCMKSQSTRYVLKQNDDGEIWVDVSKNEDADLHTVDVELKGQEHFAVQDESQHIGTDNIKNRTVVSCQSDSLKQDAQPYLAIPHPDEFAQNLSAIPLITASDGITPEKSAWDVPIEGASSVPTSSDRGNAPSLLLSGADRDLIWAVRGHDWAYAAECIAAGASQPTLNAQLVEVAQSGNVTAIARLLALGASPGAAGPTAPAWGALHWAAFRGHAAAADALVRAGAPPDGLAGEPAVTPLHLAAVRGRVGAAARLLALGADPAAPDALGQTPREVAAAAGQVAMCELLDRAAAAAADAADAATTTTAAAATAAAPA